MHWLRNVYAFNFRCQTSVIKFVKDNIFHPFKVSRKQSKILRIQASNPRASLNTEKCENMGALR